MKSVIGTTARGDALYDIAVSIGNNLPSTLEAQVHRRGQGCVVPIVVGRPLSNSQTLDGRRCLQKTGMLLAMSIWGKVVDCERRWTMKTFFNATCDAMRTASDE